MSVAASSRFQEYIEVARQREISGEATVDQPYFVPNNNPKANILGWRDGSGDSNQPGVWSDTHSPFQWISRESHIRPNLPPVYRTRGVSSNISHNSDGRPRSRSSLLSFLPYRSATHGSRHNSAGVEKNDTPQDPFGGTGTEHTHATADANNTENVHVTQTHNAAQADQTQAPIPATETAMPTTETATPVKNPQRDNIVDPLDISADQSASQTLYGGFTFDSYISSPLKSNIASNSFDNSPHLASQTTAENSKRTLPESPYKAPLQSAVLATIHSSHNDHPDEAVRGMQSASTEDVQSASAPDPQSAFYNDIDQTDAIMNALASSARLSWRDKLRSLSPVRRRRPASALYAKNTHEQHTPALDDAPDPSLTRTSTPPRKQRGVNPFTLPRFGDLSTDSLGQLFYDALDTLPDDPHKADSRPLSHTEASAKENVLHVPSTDPFAANEDPKSASAITEPPQSAFAVSDSLIDRHASPPRDRDRKFSPPPPLQIEPLEEGEGAWNDALPADHLGSNSALLGATAFAANDKDVFVESARDDESAYGRQYKNDADADPGLQADPGVYAGVAASDADFATPADIGPAFDFVLPKVPQREFCLECALRDKDMISVDVTSPGVWDPVDPQQLYDITGVVPAPGHSGPTPATEINLAIWTNVGSPSPSSTRWDRMLAFLDEQTHHLSRHSYLSYSPQASFSSEPLESSAPNSATATSEVDAAAQTNGRGSHQRASTGSHLRKGRNHLSRVSLPEIIGVKKTHNRQSSGLPSHNRQSSGLPSPSIWSRLRKSSHSSSLNADESMGHGHAPPNATLTSMINEEVAAADTRPASVQRPAALPREGSSSFNHQSSQTSLDDTEKKTRPSRFFDLPFKRKPLQV